MDCFDWEGGEVNSDDLKQLGQKLKMMRESKNLSLHQISSNTKINASFLKNFEEGIFDFLPEFYLRNFFKIYLQQLGKEAQKSLEDYDKIIHSVTKSEPPEEISKNIVSKESRFQSLLNFFKPIKIYLSRNN